MGFSFLVNIPLNRMLGPTNKGIYSYFFLIPGMIMMFGNFGFFSASTYFSANKKYSIEKVISQAIYMIAILFIIMLFVLIAWLFFIKDQVFLNNPLFIFLIIIFLLISLFNDFFGGITQGLNKISTYNISRLLYGILNILALLAIMLFFKTNLLMLVIIEGILIYLPGLFFLMKQIPSFKLLPFDIRYFKDSLRYGIKVYLAGLGGYLHLNIDMVMISRMLNMTQLGLYSLAVGLAEKFFLVVSASSFALIPRACADGGNYKMTAKVCRINMFIGIFFTAFIIIIIKPLIVFLYSESFAQAVAPLIIILPGIVVWSVPTMISADLNARNKAEYVIYSSFIALIVNIVLNFLLIPWLGINGAALSSTITYCITAIVMTYFYKKVEPSVNIREILVLKKSDIVNIFINRRKEFECNE